jgi:hypothetical protein
MTPHHPHRQQWGPSPTRTSPGRLRRWVSMAVFVGLLAMPDTPPVVIPVYILLGLALAYRLSTCLSHLPGLARPPPRPLAGHRECRPLRRPCPGRA